MKKITLLLLIVYSVTKVNAQDYLISFLGTGASTTVDSVKVENITQCTSINLSGDNMLHLAALIVGVNDLDYNTDNALHIYPNPSSGACIVNYEAKFQSNTTFELFDINGKEILLEKVLLPKGNNTFILSGINKGIYYIRLSSGSYSYVEKIISINLSNESTKIKHIESFNAVENQNTEYINLKKGKSIIEMQYNTGDILKFTGKSGNYRTVFMLVPNQNQTITFNFVACVDLDNNHYSVLQIGLQIWMAENLKTTKYSNGNTIQNVTDNNAWSTIGIGACCDVNNLPSNSDIYGKLYNWYAVNWIDVPTGWHVATDADWTTLTYFLLGENVSGGKLKDKCTSLWLSPNIGASNESGFSALPSGYRSSNGTFENEGVTCYWWTSTNYSSEQAWMRYIYSSYNYVGKAPFHKLYGYPVRCVKNN